MSSTHPVIKTDSEARDFTYSFFDGENLSLLEKALCFDKYIDYKVAK